MKSAKDKSTAFTLVEMMVVVSVIGLLAAIAIPSFVRARENSRSAAFINDLRVACGAFEMYAMENKTYPPNASAGVIPSGMQPYLGDFWTRGTPIGGKWNWDRNLNGYTAGVAVTAVSADLSQLNDIDDRIDDGDLSAGQFRTRSGGYVFVIEE